MDKYTRKENTGGTRMTKKETNKQYGGSNQEFAKFCEKAEIKPTARQASKFRNGKGAAFKMSKHKGERITCTIW